MNLVTVLYLCGMVAGYAGGFIILATLPSFVILGILLALFEFSMATVYGILAMITANFDNTME